MKHVWTAEEVAILRRYYPDTSTRDLAARLGLTINQIHRKANQLQIKKSARCSGTIYSGRCQPGERRARATEFKKGHTPHNKGKTMPIGKVVMSRGYSKKKIANNRDDSDWKLVHVLVWEAAHGPVPAGHVIIFKDHDRRNVALDNLACISRADNMRLNSIQRYPDELKRTIRAVAKLRKKIQDKQHEKQD